MVDTITERIELLNEADLSKLKARLDELRKKAEEQTATEKKALSNVFEGLTFGEILDLLERARNIT